MLTSPRVAPGFFGKVPARGDFVSRRVPAALRIDWERWLAGLVIAARDALGEAWPNDWLTAPLWHFALGSDVSPPSGAAGVLVASADRVGRFFPFSLIAAAYGGPSSEIGVLRGWARSAEVLTLHALEDDFDPEGLDLALIKLGPPAALEGPSSATGYWPLAFDGEWPSDSIDPGMSSTLRAPGPNQSVWFSRGSDRVPAMHLRCTRLPDRATAAAMISGDFDPSKD
jgi:type VI secretion system protein ImpM